MSKPGPQDLLTPARRVRGLGTARSGTIQFWHQRVSALALISLSIIFVVVVVALIGRNHAAVVQILGSPLVAIFMLLFIGASVYHMWLGMQEIILDYVHGDLMKFFLLLTNTNFCFLVAVTCGFAILKLSFGV